MPKKSLVILYGLRLIASHFCWREGSSNRRNKTAALLWIFVGFFGAVMFYPRKQTKLICIFENAVGGMDYEPENFSDLLTVFTILGLWKRQRDSLTSVRNISSEE